MHLDTVKKEVLLRYIEQLQQEFNVSSDELVAFVQEQSASFVPVDLFATRTVSGLQALVTYLREKRGYSFSKIGTLLGRNERTIWTAYAQAKKKTKVPSQLPEKAHDYIPISRFRDRKLSILEHLVSYLRENDYSNKEIAQFLKRKQTTISTVVGRAAKKRGEVQ